MEDAKLEVEALRSIFADELIVDESEIHRIVVSKKVRPNDEDGVSSASIVAKFELNSEYPGKPPLVNLTNPRGISDSAYYQLEQEVETILREKSGVPVLFDIIQHCSDFLIANQHSTSLLCPICLCSLSSLAISSTPCEHYMHAKCLEEHTFHTRKQLGEKLLNTPQHMRYQIDKSLLCPVCREVIDENIVPINSSSDIHVRSQQDILSSWTKPQELEQFDFNWKKWHDEQAALRLIYDRQKEKGGIIDLEAERKKNLITENTVILLSSPTESTLMDSGMLSSFGTTNTDISSALSTSLRTGNSSSGQSMERLFMENRCCHERATARFRKNNGPSRGVRCDDDSYIVTYDKH